MWMQPVPDGDRTPISVPPGLLAAIGLTVAVTLVFGIIPGVITRFGTWPSWWRSVRTPLDDLVAALAREHGPLRFDEVVALALYHRRTASTVGGPDRGDFLTSPEVGPLFGAVLARALDAWWRELGRPDPYPMIEARAGGGTLARSVFAAEPECRPALRYVAVEASPVAPEQTTWSARTLPDGPIEGVVIANELLDNLPFRLLLLPSAAGRRCTWPASDGTLRGC